MVGKATSMIVFAVVLSACSHGGVITHVSADYNKAMTDVRNEQLLLNIMRASAREPLQFSAMGEIAATIHRDATIGTTLDKLIAGGKNSVANTINFGVNNEPVIKLTPLSNKEFIAGILRPTTPETLKEFTDFGWDPEFMLPLLVAGYQCPGTAYQANSGRTEADVIRANLSPT